MGDGPALACSDFRAPEWRGRNEREWCEFVVSRDEWLPILGLTHFDRVDIEVQAGKSRSTGLPRFDAVGWVGQSAYIIEAKVKCTATELMSGIGQLMYYREAARSMGWDVAGLILVSPAWPPFFADTLMANKLPVTAVRLTPDDFTALVSGKL